MQLPNFVKQTTLVTALVGAGLVGLSATAKANTQPPTLHSNLAQSAVPNSASYPELASPTYLSQAVRIYAPVREYRTLPPGYRRVVIRNRVFYTNDDRTYFGYSPARRSFVVLNPNSFTYAPAPVYRPARTRAYVNPNPGLGYTVLPPGYRRVVIRNRVFYTNNNRDYLGYSPSRRQYVIINPFSFF
ncbi:MAG TPA: hypothetical protein V6D19_24860 [Stenomitos sp.]